MSRENLRPAFKSVPRLVLVAFVVVVGLPIHVAVGTWSGIRSGFDSWWRELLEAWMLDRQLVTKELVVSRIRQNRMKICDSDDCKKLGKCNAFDPEVECPVYKSR